MKKTDKMLKEFIDACQRKFGEEIVAIEKNLALPPVYALDQGVLIE